MKSVSRTLFTRLAALLLFGALSACATLNPETAGEENPVVLAYTEAFNARDAMTMGEMMHEDIEWLSITDDGVEYVALGRDDLVRDMKDYFEYPNAVTSKLSGWALAGPYVSTAETVAWTDEDGVSQTQSALVVYEVTDDQHIRRIWYYPAVDAE